MESADRCDAWRGLEELRRGLRGLLAGHCSDENDIDDVVQDTLLRAARYRSRLADGERLRPWAMRIALNVLADRRRRAARVRYAPNEDELLRTIESLEPGPEDCVEEERIPFERWTLGRGEAVGHLLRSVAGMRPEDREILAVYYGGGRSCRETAVACDVPRHLVKVRLFRARQRLVRALRRRLALEVPRTEVAA